MINVKSVVLSVLIAMHFTVGVAQSEFKPNQKGGFYFYWGWNKADYTRSDLHLWGTDYDVTLSKIQATDRQSPFSTKIYLNPKNLTIPQTNMRLGYYFKDKYQVSLGVDHMKYVMVSGQTVKMNGTIANSGTAYDGTYSNTDFVVAPSFLLFEHTDGLNYLNTELRRSDVWFSKKHLWISSQVGGGVGALMPKTNATLLNNARNDEFHLAGYGLAVMGGININFYKYFFIQGELKGGFIHMPYIRTTQFDTDHASQHFMFAQYNVSIGFQYPFGAKK